MASFKVPSQLLTILDVVNMCLASIGTDQVTSYLDSSDADVGMILNELNIADLEVQNNSGDGWSFNSDESFLLPLNGDGTISLPSQTLSVRSAYWLTNGTSTLVSERPVGRLYDQLNHTNIFTTPILVDLVVRQDFETIPNIFRNWIGRLAAHRFQGKQQGSTIVYQITGRDVAMAEAACQSHDDSSRPQNSINANKGVMNKLYGQGVRRNRQGQ